LGNPGKDALLTFDRGKRHHMVLEKPDLAKKQDVEIKYRGAKLDVGRLSPGAEIKVDDHLLENGGLFPPGWYVAEPSFRHRMIRRRNGQDDVPLLEYTPLQITPDSREKLTFRLSE